MKYNLRVDYYELSFIEIYMMENRIKYKIDKQDSEYNYLTVNTSPKKFQDVLDMISKAYI